MPQKYVYLLFFFLFLTFPLLAQLSLEDFNQQRIEVNKTAMTILGIWGAGNLLSGAILQNKKEGIDRNFYRMNMGWGAVNLALAGFAYWSSVKTDPAAYDLFQSMQEQHKIQKILLFNAGLDVGYIMGGLYLREKGKNQTSIGKRRQQLGYGKSIVLQGAFLLVFDLSVYFIHASHNQQLEFFLNGLSLSPNGLSWGLTF